MYQYSFNDLIKLNVKSFPRVYIKSWIITFRQATLIFKSFIYFSCAVNEVYTYNFGRIIHNHVSKVL